jgi:hypothetical protein
LNPRTITLHGDMPEPANPMRDGNSADGSARLIFVKLDHKQALELGTRLCQFLGHPTNLSL